MGQARDSIYTHRSQLWRATTIPTLKAFAFGCPCNTDSLLLIPLWLLGEGSWWVVQEELPLQVQLLLRSSKHLLIPSDSCCSFWKPDAWYQAALCCALTANARNENLNNKWQSHQFRKKKKKEKTHYILGRIYAVCVAAAVAMNHQKLWSFHL